MNLEIEDFNSQLNRYINDCNLVLRSGQTNIRQKARAVATRGQAKQHLGDLNGALADLNEAIRLAPDDHRAYLIRAEIWRLLGRADLAARDRQQAHARRDRKSTVRHKLP
jgi:Tfp pilus assembly protein PilF